MDSDLSTSSTLNKLILPLQGKIELVQFNQIMNVLDPISMSSGIWNNHAAEVRFRNKGSQ